MRGMPFNLQGKKGALEVGTELSVSSLSSNQWGENKKSNKRNEPTSVLDNRGSPSSPTSTSTLSSSSLGGSTDTAGVAAVSDTPPFQKWPPSQQQHQQQNTAAGSDGGGSSSGGRKEEWSLELQPIPGGLEIAGSEKCGMGMEDWEIMLSESASSPSQEQSFLRFILGDIDDPSSSLKQIGNGGGGEFDSPASGFGFVDTGFESIGGGVVSAPASNANNFSSASTELLSLNHHHHHTDNTNRLVSISIPNPSSLPPMFSHQQPNNLQFPLAVAQGLFYQTQQQNQFEPIEEKPQLFNPHHAINHNQTHPPQNPSFFLSLPYPQHEQNLILPPQAKRHHPIAADPSFQIQKNSYSDSGQEIFLHRQQQQPPGYSHLPYNLQQRPEKPKGVVNEVAHQQQQQQQNALIEQLLKAAELIETGNSVHARGILARLNHQLSPVGKPFTRAAFYFKVALELLLPNNTPHSPLRPNSTPLDIVLKISSYKTFCEISPILQFSNFTCNQALLETLDGFNQIHIVDFDIGLGGQWASLMQELALKSGGPPSLKITAFASPSSHHPLELCLTRENLTHFASGLNISFEFNVVNIESFDPTALPSLVPAIINISDNEAIAVNFPVGSSNPCFPSFLPLIKQLSPKLLVSIDQGSNRNDLSFANHVFHALNSYSLLLDSLDATNENPDVIHKIERFLIQRRIESTILGRSHSGVHNKMMPWRSLFVSAGFSPLHFSNFTETQADCLMKRLQVRGFHVEKSQGSLLLYWLQGELVSASAWR